MTNDNREIHVDEERASGGSKEGVVRWVLAASLVLVIVAMSIIWIIPALFQGDVEEEATVSGAMEADTREAGNSTDGIITEENLADDAMGEPEAADPGVGTVEN